jgi:hypothetical protein
MKRLLCSILFLPSTLCWGSPEHHLKGIENQLHELRAAWPKTHLSERQALSEKIAETEAWLKAQKRLLQAPTGAPVSTTVEPLVHPDQHPWVPETRDGSAVSFETIPEQNTFVFNYGRSNRQRRETKALNSSTSYQVEEFAQQDQNAMRRKTTYAPLPTDANATPADLLAGVHPMVIPHKNLNIPVPKGYQEGSWWLYEKKQHGGWEKIRSGWKDQNIVVPDRSEGPSQYRFTKTDHLPSDEAPHYYFWVDTQAPVITKWDKELDRNGLCHLHWITNDLPLQKVTVSVTVFKKDASVLLTLGDLSAQGKTVLAREQFKWAHSAKVLVQDQAGHETVRWLKF